MYNISSTEKSKVQPLWLIICIQTVRYIWTRKAHYSKILRTTYTQILTKHCLNKCVSKKSNLLMLQNCLLWQVPLYYIPNTQNRKIKAKETSWLNCLSVWYSYLFKQRVTNVHNFRQKLRLKCSWQFLHFSGGSLFVSAKKCAVLKFTNDLGLNRF